ncbi:MAG: AAA family ATPase [Chryseobacterium sp.]|jgi:chromosome partitioning protein
MIFAIGNLKGGVGKTTIAVNLVSTLAEGQGNTLLIDAEGTAIAFTELRKRTLIASPYETRALQGKAIYNQRDKIKTNFTNTVIDIGGEDATGSLRASLLIADVVLIPVKPRSFDLWRTEETFELVKEAQSIRGNSNSLRAVAVINEADPQGQDNQATIDYLKSLPNLEVAPVLIGRRKAFSNAAAAGLTVLEYKADPKATKEISTLIDFLITI